MRPSRLGIMIVAITVYSPTMANVNNPIPGVELRLSKPQERYGLGEAVQLAVLVFNGSSKEFPVGKQLHPTVSNPSYLLVSLEDAKGNYSPDRVWSEFLTPEFLKEWWTYIQPGHFYGAEIFIDDKTHEFLGRPGRYCATAKYVAKPSSKEGNKLLWSGQLESNRVCFEVVTHKPPEAK